MLDLHGLAGWLVVSQKGWIMGQFWTGGLVDQNSSMPASLAVSHRREPCALFQKGWISGLHAAVDGVDREDLSCRCQAGSVSQKGARSAQSAPGGFPPGVLTEGVDLVDWRNSLLPSWLGLAEGGPLAQN